MSAYQLTKPLNNIDLLYFLLL